MMPSDYLALQEASKAQILREAAAGWGSVVDRTEYLYDDSSFGYSRSLPFTSADDRKGGAFRPVYYTESDLAAIRAQVRNLWGITPIPNGVVETLANYTFGTGIGYTVQSEVDNPRLLTAIQKTIDQFVKDHGLDGDMDREIHRRTREDGEAFVRLRWIDGRANAQFIEPDCITEPGNPLSVEEYCGLEAGGCWRFGVHTDSDDTSNVRGYYVYWGESDRDWEYVPECRMGHFKRNVTAAAKRGVSDFYDLISDLYNEARLTGNATSGAALQAAIAWIRQTPAGTTSSQATNLGATGAVRTASRPTSSGGTALTNVGRYAPNTVLTVPAGQEYKPGPLGAERNAGFDLIGQRVLKRCGVRWSMPEGMISGDASNNNYASALVAQSPFVKGRQADQTWYGKRTISLLWKVIRLAWEHGRFDRYGVSIEQMQEHCDITASYPTVENMDPLQQVQVQKAQRELGILSLTTAAKQAGYDLEEEQRLGAKAPEPAPQMPPGMMNPAMLAQQAKMAGQVPNPALETDAVSESFDESKVSRHPAGGSDGGRFAPKSGGGGGAQNALAIAIGRGIDHKFFGNEADAKEARKSFGFPEHPGLGMDSMTAQQRIAARKSPEYAAKVEAWNSDSSKMSEKAKAESIGALVVSSSGETGRVVDWGFDASGGDAPIVKFESTKDPQKVNIAQFSSGQYSIASVDKGVSADQPKTKPTEAELKIEKAHDELKAFEAEAAQMLSKAGHKKAASNVKKKGILRADGIPAEMLPDLKAAYQKYGTIASMGFGFKESVEVPESALECGGDMRQAVAIALESAGTTAEARAILEQLLEFDESKINRQPSGSDKGGEFAPKSGGRFPASKMPKDMTGRVDLVDDNTGEILMSDDAEVIRQAVRDSIAGGDDMSGLHVRPEDSKAAAKYEEDRKAAEAKREAEREARRKADELGNKPGGSQWVAPPEKIYHATFAADAILKDGFKTADQLGSGSDVLGGSNRGNVSFTTLENARTYRDGLSVARDAAQGRIDPDDAKRMQEIGKQFGVAPDRMKAIVADSGDAPKEKRMFRILQRVSLEGQKFPLFMGTDWSKTVQSAAVPRILEIPSSGPKEYSYVKSETEWRIGDPQKITSIKRVE